MLQERSILDAVAPKDRVLLGSQHLLWKYMLSTSDVSMSKSWTDTEFGFEDIQRTFWQGRIDNWQCLTVKTFCIEVKTFSCWALICVGFQGWILWPKLGHFNPHIPARSKSLDGNREEAGGSKLGEIGGQRQRFFVGKRVDTSCFWILVGHGDWKAERNCGLVVRVFYFSCPVWEVYPLSRWLSGGLEFSLGITLTMAATTAMMQPYSQKQARMTCGRNDHGQFTKPWKVMAWKMVHWCRHHGSVNPPLLFLGPVLTWTPSIKIIQNQIKSNHMK